MTTTLSKNVVLLGANSDIGKLVVRRGSKSRNITVLAVSRSKECPGSGDSTQVFRLGGIDLVSEKDLRKLSAIVAKRFTTPFSIVHCVGNFWIHKPLTQTPFAEIRETVESQFLSLCGVARFLTPIMKKVGGGRIVAFSCNSVGYNYPDMSPFTASKAAIECFVKCYANEHAKFGISACALSLPTILTPKVRKEKPKGDHKNYIRPEELADFILNYLLKQPHEVNGNVVKVFKHSRTFYHKSYYERNPRRTPSRTNNR